MGLTLTIREDQKIELDDGDTATIRARPDGPRSVRVTIDAPDDVDISPPVDDRTRQTYTDGSD